MTETKAGAVRAVFISYARDDSAAAIRITEALRERGVEVWLDQAELVGGEAWDATIKRQIRECALFIPIISAQTQRRIEGYFRREWLLAAERTRDMAQGVTFIVPLAIDDVSETVAVVPEEFLRVHWLRLAGGVPTPEFLAEIVRLLRAPRQAATIPPWAGSPLRRALGRRPAWLMAAALAMGGAAFLLYLDSRSSPNRPASTPPPIAGAEQTAAAPAPPGERSVAVLPFANLSPEKDDDYLSDGITEEILVSLAKVPGLRVPARTSSFAFKDKHEDARKIGELLQVSTVLEGSVRREGNQLRVTAQLINAADGFRLWVETYDRDMTNLLALQDEIARAIATRLAGSLTEGRRLPSAALRNANVEAYTLVLQGRFHSEKQTEPSLRRGIAYFQEALARQPDYAVAYAGLAGAYGLQRYWAYAPPAAVTAQMRAAVAQAQALDDALPSVHASLAFLSFWVDWDWAAAEREFLRALELDPSQINVRQYYAYLLAATGRSSEAVAAAAAAAQLDPLAVNARVALGWTYLFAGDRDRAAEAGRRALALAPDSFGAHQLNGRILFAQGKREEGLAHLERANRLVAVAEVAGNLGWMYGQMGRRADALRLLENLQVLATRQYVPALAIANIHQGLGDFAQADEWVQRAIADREGRLVFMRVDETFRANPHAPEWRRKIGLKD